HPATHGVLRLIVDTDGEVVANCTPDHGYLHRSIEKIGECVEWPMFVPYTDRVDYVCAMNANLAYCVAVEKLLSSDTASRVEVPLRAECIRVIVAGLDMDFRGEPFGPIPQLLSLADQVDKLQAICIICGEPAYCTQRLVNGHPAHYHDPVIIVGAQEMYEARCRRCHKIPKD
ncbi:MAG: hypothetical protein HUU38_31110, partial [Anaerolineales bacterium]|nr:hypothetical protein [Anaerolineales bacterium]